MFVTLRQGAAKRPARVRESLPLSPNEERYLLAESLTNQVYMAPAALRIVGPVDMDRMEAILQATCDRHEARRTGFEATGDGRLTKYVEDRARIALRRMSLPGASDAELRDLVRRHVMRKGDFSPADLHRFILVEVGPEDHVFGWGLHHATSDGVTGTAFMVEVMSRLFGMEFSEPSPQYSDFWDFDWKGSDAYRAAEAFWTERLAGLSDSTAWPADLAGHEPPAARPGVKFTIPPEVVGATRAAAEAIGATHFTYFYAVYMVLLRRLTGSGRVSTTFQSAGRRGKPGAEGAHGVFSNSLILATQVDEAESIRTLAGRLRGEIREAIAHEIMPYHHVIRATGVHPRYAINWYPQSPPGGVPGVRFESIGLDENQDDDDLNLRFFTYPQGAEYGEGSFLSIYYNPAAFSAARVQAVAEQMIALAAGLARDVDAPIGAVRSASLAPPGVLPDIAAPLPSGGGEGLIHQGFLARAQASPGAIAILHGGGDYTYGELERWSRALAQAIRARGLGPGERVAILADRGPQLVAAVLAVARSGAAFAVLDAGCPEPRLETLVQGCAPRAILWAGEARLAGLAERLSQSRGLAILGGAPVSEAGDAASSEGLDAANPADVAYLLFTSGTTGEPKCVATAHAPLGHFLRWQAETFGLTAQDRFTLLSGLSHDPLLRDIFAPLSLGAALLIPDDDLTLEPAALAEWLRMAGATVMHITPPVGQVLAAGSDRRRPIPALRRIFWGGDVLRPSLIQALGALTPNARHVNVYGCTETPQVAGFCEFDGEADRVSVPVGSGIDGVQLLVVDADRRPVGIGEVGEIAVRSNYLSLGELRNGRLAPPDDRGVDGAGEANIYFTGDRGLYLPDGKVLFLGRADHQVKVRGHRVDLSEITAALEARPQVRAAVALAAPELGQMRIVGFIAGPRRAAFDEVEFRASLAARLPAHMVPYAIRWVESLPLSPNGKVDRQALLNRIAVGEPREAQARPPTATERALMAAWSEVLGPARMSPDASFASLGGDSLNYVQAYLATEEVLGDTPEGWQLMTIAELARGRRPAAGRRTIDMPLLVRAASIVLVVCGHFALFQYGGGATSLLMLVSGYMFGGLALQDAFTQQAAAPALRTLRNILVPTFALSLFIWLARMPGSPPEPYILLLTADLQDYPASDPQELYLWYVHCLLHIMAFLYLAVLSLKLGGGFGIGRRRFLWALFALGCVGRFVLPWTLDHHFFQPSHHRDIVYLLPTTHLATVMLGGLATTLETRRQRLWLATTVFVYALASGWCFGPNQALFLLIGGGLLLSRPRLAAPSSLSTLVASLAGASLWIYLSHMIVRDGLRHLGLPSPLVGVIIALAVGVGAWMLWTRAVVVARRWIRRAPAMAAEPAV
jgi:amino acid adenylation domain-containing protein